MGDEHEFFGIKFSEIRLGAQANSYFRCGECFAVVELDDTIAHAKHHDLLLTALEGRAERVLALEDAVRELQQFMREATGSNVIELQHEQENRRPRDNGPL